ncbi:tRNA(His) guanylyltransferase Thg1 family protein [Massilia pseudoviolaceinigra]|uniref:tRNA(His) guanylyltransferase Thg1 family protein n=1 Tax=Massilia pseudoviolaceinigra TaxID=3057165 RepID=UPI002796C359|nr:tRNA(His) guanylyltransferase Thg1 family protein [Massilia sp. CCM 9206]MDQ1921882.1 tRNA(His) guanylyltransferase Thg1 family protein [Massilia sp. CCM 9206]
MKFDELDAMMRGYETANDRCVEQGVYMVARIDGRSFTKLTKEKVSFEAPFDVRFRDLMAETTRHLMNCGFKVVYGYTESDEISLLFDLDIDAYGRKLRKYNSILAGETSAKFSLMLGELAAFDCRICELPDRKIVVDYFRWRNEDAHRNGLNAHCYWMLRKEGVAKGAAAAQIEGRTIEDKVALLASRGTDFHTLPSWQLRGTGFYWVDEEKRGYNPKEQLEVVSSKRVIKTDLYLPVGEAYGDFVRGILT